MSGLRQLRRGGGLIGVAILTIVLLIALVGPFVAPYSPDATVGVPGSGPSAATLLGTDMLGRDVLSRVLWGGRSLLAIAVAATAIAAVVGTTIGLVAGYSRSLVDPVLMRAVDVMLVFPPLLFFLILVTAVGSSPVVLIFGIAAVLFPGVARLVHTLTREASVRGFVEAAVARGERTPAVLVREVLPNIVGPLLAQVGLTLTFSILIAAGVNFLGLGLQPPKADWGVMIAENRQVMSADALAVLVPAGLIALLTVGINLMTDSVGRTLGREAAHA
jgi:peptide/nickel transport system permease protein